MKMPNSTAEGQNMKAWVTHHSLSSLEDFLMWDAQLGDLNQTTTKILLKTLKGLNNQQKIG